MTHDVIRDLLGVKLDMTTYVVIHLIRAIFVGFPLFCYVSCYT
jgi:hypothetical protein